MLALRRPNVNVFFPSQADNEASGGNVVRKKHSSVPVLPHLDTLRVSGAGVVQLLL